MIAKRDTKDKFGVTVMSFSPQPIIELANAFYGSATLFAASDAGVFTLLERYPNGASCEQVAMELKLETRACRLLLDGCVAIGLLAKTGSSYTNSAQAAQFLVAGKPGDLSGAIRYNRDVYAAWGKLPAFLQTGQPVEKPELHLGDDSARTRTFVLSMHHRAMAIGRGVVPLLQLDGVGRLLDCAGGPGTFACLCAKAQPSLQAVVLDLPPVVAIAEELIAQMGLTERVRTLGGSYHETPFPAGQDRVHFFGCLHQESPDAIRKLFAKAFAALKSGGKICVMDLMTDATHASPAFSALFALNMALTTQSGWVFSDEELKGWLAEAGFVRFEVKPLPAPMPHWLAFAEKP